MFTSTHDEGAAREIPRERGHLRHDPRAVPAEERPTVEDLVDEILEGSFPASDPPAWGTAAARLRHREDERYS